VTLNSETRRSLERVSIVAIVTAGLVAGVSVTVGAAPVPQFVSGQPLTATELNALVDAVNSPLAENGALSYSAQAIYCEASMPVTGDVGGYQGAKALCEDTCGSASAHVCTADELLRSLGLGVELPSVTNYRFATGITWGGTAGQQADCRAFSQATEAYGGAVWSVDHFDITGCSTAYPMLCCD
jgi:hypothetical protein